MDKHERVARELCRKILEGAGVPDVFILDGVIYDKVEEKRGREIVIKYRERKDAKD